MEENIVRRSFSCFTDENIFSVGLRNASLWFDVRTVVVQNEWKRVVSDSCMMDTLHSCLMALSKREV